MGSGVPVRAKRFEAPVLANRPVAGPYHELILEAPELAASVHAGQFVNVLCSAGHDPLLRRPFSVYRVDRARGTLSLLYEVLGRGTALMARWREGDRADLLGPLGNFFPLPEGKGPVALVAGGIGVAPLVALAAEIAPSGREVKAFLGARTGSLLVGEEDLLSLGVQVEVATDDGSRGTAGFVTTLLEMHWGDCLSGKYPLAEAAFACGPVPMMAAVTAVARHYGVPCWVSMEASMACGFGVCMGCAWPVHPREMTGRAGASYALVCVEGPIFAAGEVVWPSENTPKACHCNPGAGGKDCGGG